MTAVALNAKYASRRWGTYDSTAHTYTVSAPSGIAAGDLILFLFAHHSQATPPEFSLAGWVKIGGSSGTSSSNCGYYKIAGASEPSSYVFNVTNDTGQWDTSTTSMTMASFTNGRKIRTAGFSSSVWSSSKNSSLAYPVVDTAIADDLVVGFGNCNVNDSNYIASSTQGSDSYAEFDTNMYAGSAQWERHVAFTERPATVGATTARTFSASYSAPTTMRIVVATNNPPNKPTVQVSSTIDSGATNRISAPFSDPDPGDSPSQTDFQWWDLTSGSRTGGPYTQTVSGSTPTYWDSPGGTFSNGDKEIQAQSYDALGTPSGWGPSAFFTAATPTGVPTINAPVNGGTISTQTYTVQWSTAGGQVAYQIRRVADNAGAADATTVYWDSGQITDANARSLSVPFETNNRWEHVQLRVTADGTLWSSWADARVDVSYTAPAAPTISLSPDAGSGSLLVNVTNPVPGSGQPSVSYNEVWVDDGQGAGWERVATYLATNTAYRYPWPISGRSYAGNLKAVAVASNGVTAETIA